MFIFWRDEFPGHYNYYSLSKTTATSKKSHLTVCDNWELCNESLGGYTHIICNQRKHCLEIARASKQIITQLTLTIKDVDLLIELSFAFVVPWLGGKPWWRGKEVRWCGEEPTPLREEVQGLAVPDGGRPQECWTCTGTSRQAQCPTEEDEEPAWRSRE